MLPKAFLAAHRPQPTEAMMKCLYDHLQLNMVLHPDKSIRSNSCHWENKPSLYREAG
jgi:hypothetical protein